MAAHGFDLRCVVFTINSPHQNAHEEKGRKLFLEEQQTVQVFCEAAAREEVLFYDALCQTCCIWSRISYFFIVLSAFQHFLFPPVEVILDRLTRSSSPTCVWLCEKVRHQGKSQLKGEQEWEWRGRSKWEMEGRGRERSPSLMWALITCQRSMIHLPLHTHTHLHTHTTQPTCDDIMQLQEFGWFCLTAKSLLCHGPIPSVTQPLLLS